ncbi:MAG: AAA family ATPase [Thaumarchaeota archaeon]|nr:AAA family ATPase [Nitrososphaerota archaeon]MDD9813989.1 AAA family ATPase [Nitrososphaerota archaeon]
MTRGGNRARAAGAPLEIGVSNFGPISRGTFRIAPMTILVGPNNSGKTYAALLAHSVLSCMSASADPQSLAALAGERLKSPKFRRLVLAMGSLAGSAGTGRVSVPPGMSRQVCDLFAASAFARRLALEIEGNFGCGLASLARAGSTSSQIRLSDGVISACLMLGKSGSLAARLVIPEAQYGITSRAGQISVYGRKNGGMPRDAFCHDASINDRAAQALDALDMSENSGLRAVLALFMKIEQLFLVRPGLPYYIPAGRSGILAPRGIRRLNAAGAMGHGEGCQGAGGTGALSDAVALFYRTAAQRRPFPKNAKTAVGEMFGGRLVLPKSRHEQPKIAYTPSGTEIPLWLAPPGTADAATFQLFQSGSSRADVLVFEEPEAHLHPESQTRLAKHIVRLVNGGTHAILATHSVHFLEQMSLFLKMSRLTPRQRQKLKYAPGDFLDNDDVSPHAFRACPKGGYEIREIEHSVADGISQDDFMHVIEYMYEEDLAVEQAVEM